MSAILSHITPFKNSRHVVMHTQSIGDIMQGILTTHNQHKKDYDKICNSFDAPTHLEICRKIYNYLKANTIYKVEPDEFQTLRSPAAILTLGKNPKIGLDCKSYSLFAGGVIDALNRQGKKINWCYRFASYKPFDRLPHHVFVVVNPGTSNEIWCDPVIPFFNYHKSYHYKIDKKPMALVQIAGIGRRSKADRKARKKVVKEKIKAKIKKGLKVVVKLNPATAPARNSFLLMVKLNVFGLARNLAKVQLLKEKDLIKFWEKIGGSYKSLQKAIDTGKNKGHHKKVSGVGVGVLPAIAAAIAAATPIIIKVKALLKSAGIDTKDLEAKAKSIISKVANKKIDDFATNQIDAEDAGETGIEQFNSSDAENSSESSDDFYNETEDDAGKGNEEESESEDIVSGVFIPKIRKGNMSYQKAFDNVNRLNSKYMNPLSHSGRSQIQKRYF